MYTKAENTQKKRATQKTLNLVVFYQKKVHPNEDAH